MKDGCWVGNQVYLPLGRASFSNQRRDLLLGCRKGFQQVEVIRKPVFSPTRVKIFRKLYLEIEGAASMETRSRIIFYLVGTS